MYNNIWFSSDHHFYHKSVISYCNRPFDDVEDMNEALIANWNLVVRPRDTVHHLGDFAFANTGKVLELRKHLNGFIHLTKGNHDYRWSQAAFSAFDSVKNLREIKVDKQTIVLCHFPILSWHKMAHGSYHLHGHQHCIVPFDFNVKRLDVGVDGHGYRPINFEEVREIMTKGENFKYALTPEKQEKDLWGV